MTFFEVPSRTRLDQSCDAQTPSRNDLFADYPDLLAVKHIKELTGLSEQTIRSEINRGALPGARIGRRLYVPKTMMIDYVTNGGGLNDR